VVFYREDFSQVKPAKPLSVKGISDKHDLDGFCAKCEKNTFDGIQLAYFSPAR